MRKTIQATNTTTTRAQNCRSIAVNVSKMSLLDPLACYYGRTGTQEHPGRAQNTKILLLFTNVAFFALSWRAFGLPFLPKLGEATKDSKRHQKTAKDTERQRALSHRGDHLDPPLAQNWRKEGVSRPNSGPIASSKPPQGNWVGHLACVGPLIAWLGCRIGDHCAVSTP